MTGLKNEVQINKLLDHLSTMQIGFVAINGYTNKDGEVSTRRINIGFSYEKLKKDDLKTLTDGVAFIPSVENKYSKADWDNAVLELKASIIKPNENRSEGQTNAYLKMTDNGAVKYNYETQELYISGLELKGSKEVIEEGNYKEVKSSAKTIAKNAIRKAYLKAGNIRTFKVIEIGEVKLKGDTIELG